MSKVDIANKALSYLGEETILSFNDETTPARLMNIHYDQSKRHLLLSHHWFFAMVRAAFVEITPHTDDQYQYAFQVPSNCLKIVHANEKCTAFRRFGDQIWANVSTFTAEYVSDCDESLFSPSFEEALTYYLASKVALELSGSNTVKGESYQMYSQAMLQAIAVNDTEQGALEFDEIPGEEIRPGFTRAFYTRDLLP